MDEERAERGARRASRPQSWRHLAARIASLGSASRRRATRTTVAEGTRLVERALRAAHPIEAVLAGASFGATEREARLSGELEQAGLALVRAPDADMRAALDGRSFGSIQALVAIREDEGTELLKDDGPALLLVAVDVQEAGNAGALVRTAHALGAKAFVSLGLSDPWHPKAVRSSKGSLFALRCARPARPLEWSRELAARGYLRVGLATEHACGFDELPSGRGRAALFVGSEAHGLSRATCAELDRLVRIEMPSGVDSLSVNAAAAIGLHELRARAAREARGASSEEPAHEQPDEPEQ